MRDHGGNLDMAMARHGGEGWIDLSTGINRRPYALPCLPHSAWASLPTKTEQERLIVTAQRAWHVAPATKAVALAGAQAAIQLVPLLRKSGQARVLTPTYNEHAASLKARGWKVTESADLAALEGADLAVLVNPNNPDGRTWLPNSLLGLAAKVGFLVVDESFADATPALSLLPHALPENVLVLRSFGKFYGLAGLRLGFAFGAEPTIARLAEMAGPWPVSGSGLHIGAVALDDAHWAETMRAQLAEDATRCDALAAHAGWTLQGGTSLFRLYHTPDAKAAQDHLASHRIWSRIFPWSFNWIRLGLPGAEAEWLRLEAAMKDQPSPRAG
ncbi:MAG: threonine-phosphate decarboxylase CobD [Pseudotabrizicola sp.]|uniref:threonine-phosphate decarboxylase CobD n=1 Tax=Pseudotabrizicola sp. TaxID=2939647 RepID=UPI0027321FF4|nr:threonine-phosphate decarboxylase CobD [Pseudotabrizicola sp.]MDP2081159.1 threonine-phosphate decarboxylase CobD [Pseudotabrizicola sp.]MDZ7573113.1 threonine-phosphate decarboxylase CobD [Pseudotabrizicola sp.]